MVWKSHAFAPSALTLSRRRQHSRISELLSYIQVRYSLLRLTTTGRLETRN